MPDHRQYVNLYPQVTTPMQILTILIKSSIFDRQRELTIDTDFIKFDNSDLIAESPVKILKPDISGIRHGIKWIHGYQFVIGRIYCIDLLKADNEIVKIRLKTLYGIRKHQLAEKYQRIIHALYDNFFDDLSRSLLIKFSQQSDFEVAGVFFTQTGIRLHLKSQFIPWEDLGTKSYSTYYALFSKLDPLHYKAFEYLNDWNTAVLYSVSRSILIGKGLHPN